MHVATKGRLNWVGQSRNSEWIRMFHHRSGNQSNTPVNNFAPSHFTYFCFEKKNTMKRRREDVPLQHKFILRRSTRRLPLSAASRSSSNAAVRLETTPGSLRAPLRPPRLWHGLASSWVPAGPGMGPRRVLCIPARTHTPDASCLTPHSASGPPCHRRRGTTPASLLTSSHRRRLRRSRASRRRTHAQKIARIDHGTEMIIRQRREKTKQQDKRQSDSTCLAQHSHIPPPRRLGCSPLRSIRHKLGYYHISHIMHDITLDIKGERDL